MSHRLTLEELAQTLEALPDDPDACRAFRALAEPAVARDPLGAALALERWPTLQRLAVELATDAWIAR